MVCRIDFLRGRITFKVTDNAIIVGYRSTTGLFMAPGKAELTGCARYYRARPFGYGMAVDTF